jgi:hypothetical protein
VAVDRSGATLLIRQKVAVFSYKRKDHPRISLGVVFLLYDLKVINHKSDCKACHLDPWGFLPLFHESVKALRVFKVRIM